MTAENYGAQPAMETKPEYLEKLKVGLQVELSITGGLFRGNYLTAVTKIIKDKEIYLEMPIQDGKILKFWPQTMLYIHFTFENEPGAVYTFSGRIQKTGTEAKKEVFILNFPSKVTRVQRRNFVRVDVIIPFNYFSYKPPAPEGEEKETLVPVLKRGYSLDLSGGGIMLRTPYVLEKGQFILSDFDLGENAYRVRCQIVRVIQSSRGRKRYFKYGVIFTDINESIRRSIIGFVFEIERKKIQKMKSRAFDAPR
ncbi:MAG: PilZ domain-containing protein [Candidatus Wallbacteria bacterium]|nr:PilZ domain-containing protein [Candidatus Wallbacteria bacterium]